MPDRRTDGHQFRLLDVLQDFNREDLRIKGSLALPAERVVRALNQVNGWRSKLMTVMDDNGPEYISAIRMSWALAQHQPYFVRKIYTRSARSKSLATSA